MALCIKVYLQTFDHAPEIRRFEATKDVCSSFYKLERQIRDTFPQLKEADFQLYYKDDEGDHLAFSSDEELQIALRYREESVLRLFVKLKHNGAVEVCSGAHSGPCTKAKELIRQCKSVMRGLKLSAQGIGKEARRKAGACGEADDAKGRQYESGAESGEAEQVSGDREQPGERSCVPCEGRPPPGETVESDSNWTVVGGHLLAEADGRKEAHAPSIPESSGIHMQQQQPRQPVQPQHTIPVESGFGQAVQQPPYAPAQPTHQPVQPPPHVQQQLGAPTAPRLYPTLAPGAAQTLDQLKAMGFSDEGGWLTNLILAKNGDIGQVLDALSPATRPDQPGQRV